MSAPIRRPLAVVAVFVLAFAITSPVTTHSGANAMQGVRITIGRESAWQGMAIAAVTDLTVPTTTTAPPARVRAASARTVRGAATPATDLVQRANDALVSAIPAAWLAAVHPWFELIGGYTSWSATTGRIRISRFHASGSYERLRAIVAHEWGHQAAFRYGTHAYLGAPPEGWPYAGDRPAEAWGDCIAQTLTGLNPSRRAGECDNAALQFIRDWLARGPGG